MKMNRGDFIRGGASVFAIAAAGRAFGLNAPSNRVRLAVMGCHRRGRGFALMKSVLAAGGAEIAVVCDVDSRAREEAAAKVKELTGVEPDKACDVREVLARADVDGLICAAPDHWHATAAAWAMKAGKAIYVEKPCSFCPAEGEILVETQRKTGMVFQMGSQRRSARVTLDAMKEIHAGVIGDIHPSVTAAYGFACPVTLCEMDVEALYALYDDDYAYKSLPRFPAVERDFSFVCEETLEIGEIEKSMKRFGGKLVETIKLFDIYRGEKLGEGLKSCAFRVTLRAPDRTLTQEEADKASKKIVKDLEFKMGLKLRG